MTQGYKSATIQTVPETANENLIRHQVKQAKEAASEIPTVGRQRGARAVRTARQTQEPDPLARDDRQAQGSGPCSWTDRRDDRAGRVLAPAAVHPHLHGRARGHGHGRRHHHGRTPERHQLRARPGHGPAQGQGRIGRHGGGGLADGGSRVQTPDGPSRPRGFIRSARRGHGQGQVEHPGLVARRVAHGGVPAGPARREPNQGAPGGGGRQTPGGQAHRAGPDRGAHLPRRRRVRGDALPARQGPGHGVARRP